MPKINTASRAQTSLEKTYQRAKGRGLRPEKLEQLKKSLQAKLAANPGMQLVADSFKFVLNENRIVLTNSGPLYNVKMEPIPSPSVTPPKKKEKKQKAQQELSQPAKPPSSTSSTCSKVSVACCAVLAGGLAAATLASLYQNFEALSLSE